MKKLLVSLICALSVLGFMPLAKAKENEVVNVYMFTKEGCGYCEKASEYFSKLATDKEYGPMFNLITLEVFDGNFDVQDQDYYELLMKTAQKFDFNFKGTPFIVVGETYFDGFTQEYDEEIKKEIKRCYEDGYVDPVENIDALLAAKKDEHKGMKIFLNVVSISLVVGVVAALIISRIPRKAKVTPKKEAEVKKETEEVKETKQTSAKEKSNTKSKSSTTNKTKQKK